MNILFNMDTNDYNENGQVFSRPSARAIIIRDEKVLLIYSKKYDFYKFPGGGIETGEENTDALIREVMEETGYSVIPDSISEFGMVPRKQRDRFAPDNIFRQDNFYYLCDVSDIQSETKLEEYEAEAEYTPVWEDPFVAFNHNRYYSSLDNDDMRMIVAKRDERVLEMVYYLILDRIHEKKERELVERLGHPEYFEMVEFVKDCLKDNQTEDIGAKKNIQYSRFEHTKRVLAWAKRLYDLTLNNETELKYDELMIATIFHDVGRNNKSGLPHAKASVPITREYLLKHGYSEDKTEYICMLVGDHSDKWKMKDPGIDRNLLLLMEADMLDDMGAQGVVMDCMITARRKDSASFYDCYNHIRRFTYRQQQKNPMVSSEARAIWDKKTKLVEEFTDSLEEDIGY